MNFKDFILTALEEDVRDGDHSTLCCIPKHEIGKAILKVKENGIIAGVEVASAIIALCEPTATLDIFIKDGEPVKVGDIVFDMKATVHTILKTERLILNIMQRMSGIATLTHQYAQKIEHLPCTLLDTRKTTPNFRWFEKKAVKIGGGDNHRMGLYDMIMLKDNHIDYCGSIEKAIDQANAYCAENNLSIPIEVEARTLSDIERIVKHGGVQRIMLDNFTPEQIEQALPIIDSRFETEASGGITLETIVRYAETGVNFVSVGAVIHHAVSMDLSLKAVK